MTFDKVLETDPIVLEYKENAKRHVMNSFDVNFGEVTFGETLTE